MEQKILRLFIFNENLKFNEIEKLTSIRSNKIAYHIKQLIKKQVLVKQGEFYKLSETAEYLIPYLSDKKSPLVVLLIRIGDRRNCLLFKRDKRPFKGKLSLPGGRLLVNETIQDAVKRIMSEKYNVNAELSLINSVNLEFVKKKKKSIHSFLLILVEAKTKDKVRFSNIEKNKKDIILSDYKMIKSRQSKIKIKSFETPL